MPNPVPAPSAPLASGDPTRRHGVEVDGAVLFPGLTRPEADAAATWLGTVDAPHQVLVPVEIGVVLSDGAGPHLLDASGGLVLVLGPHAHVAGARVAMGAPSPLHAIGAVEDHGTYWVWRARRDVPEPDRVGALDSLDACPDTDALTVWGAAGGGIARTLEP
jgi:hypothetical protein